MKRALDYISSWNPPRRDAWRAVKIEDDIRDALQCIRTVRPSIALRRDLLSMVSRVGVSYALLGFPGSSQEEAETCSHLLKHAVECDLNILPVMMARPMEEDLRAILAIRDETSIPATADMFFSTSALRSAIEDWDCELRLRDLSNAAEFAHANQLDIRISLEDSSRTEPSSLSNAIQRVLDIAPKAITICDTSGDCLPEGASRLTSFVRNLVDRSGSRVEVGWHGHNDRGLALANALASIESGADVISGTFTGIGERTGNVPLEQLIVILSESGHRGFNISLLTELCRVFSMSVETPFPANLPIVGQDAFSTATGTHVASMLRARDLGQDFVNLAFSAVDASLLNRNQTFLLGPNSGRSAVKAMLEEWGLSHGDEAVHEILRYCKLSARTFHDQSEMNALATAMIERLPEHSNLQAKAI